MKIDVLGTYKFTNKRSIRPDKRCLNCPFFDEGLCWCIYLKVKIEDWNFNKNCPIIEIIVEEE